MAVFLRPLVMAVLVCTGAQARTWVNVTVYVSTAAESRVRVAWGGMAWCRCGTLASIAV